MRPGRRFRTIPHRSSNYLDWKRAGYIYAKMSVYAKKVKSLRNLELIQCRDDKTSNKRPEGDTPDQCDGGAARHTRRKAVRAYAPTSGASRSRASGSRAAAACRAGRVRL